MINHEILPLLGMGLLVLDDALKSNKSPTQSKLNSVVEKKFGKDKKTNETKIFYESLTVKKMITNLFQEFQKEILNTYGLSLISTGISYQLFSQRKLHYFTSVIKTSLCFFIGISLLHSGYIIKAEIENNRKSYEEARNLWVKLNTETTCDQIAINC